MSHRKVHVTCAPSSKLTTTSTYSHVELTHVLMTLDHHHKRVVHALTNTLQAHPMTRCFTLINDGKFNDITLYHHGTCHAHDSSKDANAQHVYTIGIVGTTLTYHPLFTPNPNLKNTKHHITYYNDTFPQEATNRKLREICHTLTTVNPTKVYHTNTTQRL